jgi:acyl-CoA thioester hydrolase
MTSAQPPAPTVAQVLELPALVKGSVTADYIDANGHMNIRHYLDHCASSADAICREIGIDDAYRAERRMGVFTAEHHLRYTGELHLGEEFTVHARVLDLSDKVGHLMAFLVDRTHDVLACTVEIVLIHVDMDSRRPLPMPADIAAGWQRWLQQSQALKWAAPVCGAMGIRR